MAIIENKLSEPDKIRFVVKYQQKIITIIDMKS